MIIEDGESRKHRQPVSLGVLLLLLLLLYPSLFHCFRYENGNCDTATMSTQTTQYEGLGGMNPPPGINRPWINEPQAGQIGVDTGDALGAM